MVLFPGGNSTVENHSYFSVGMGELLGVCVGGGGGGGDGKATL